MQLVKAEYFLFCFQVPVEDLKNASKLLVSALEIRQRYMKMSYQSFPTQVEKMTLDINQVKPCFTNF